MRYIFMTWLLILFMYQPAITLAEPTYGCHELRAAVKKHGSVIIEVWAHDPRVSDARWRYIVRCLFVNRR